MSVPSRLAWARQRAEGFMPDLAAVLRQTAASDGQGGQTLTWTTAATYPCRLVADTTTPTERQQGQQTTAVTLWRCYLPAGADVRPEDRLSINDTEYSVVDDDAEKTEGACVVVQLRREND